MKLPLEKILLSVERIALIVQGMVLAEKYAHASPTLPTHLRDEGEAQSKYYKNELTNNLHKLQALLNVQEATHVSD